jgi:PBP1b-binding outer membrane lipoprotein LpoB
MKALRYASFLVAVMVLAGCAQLGLATPETFNQKAAVAMGSVTQVRETATSLLQAKQINTADAENILKATDVARTGIDTARAMHASDPTAANSKLESIRTGLAALTAYLASKQK